MVTALSMFRRGIFLMISFIGVAGLFILLLADLLALLQIMMYVGGMLVMILFMVLFARDPGGAMMVAMKWSFIEQAFSLGIKPEQEGHEGHANGMHPEGEDGAPEAKYGLHVGDNIDRQNGDYWSQHPAKSQDPEDAHEKEGSSAGAAHSGMTHEGMMDGMKIMGMTMTTPIKRLAAVFAILAGALLISLLWLHPAWSMTTAIPDPHSAERIGLLLMSKYMIAFEGASLLILTGIFGAVLLARSGRQPANLTREDCVAVEGAPPPIEAAPLEPMAEPGKLEPEGITEIQKDERD